MQRFRISPFGALLDSVGRYQSTALLNAEIIITIHILVFESSYPPPGHSPPGSCTDIHYSLQVSVQ